MTLLTTQEALNQFVGSQGFTIQEVSNTLANLSGYVLADDVKLLLGTGSDASMYYDGTDLFINPREVGAGSVMIPLAGSFPSPDGDSVHIWRGTAGVVTGAAGAVLILETAEVTNYLHFLNATGIAGIVTGDAAASFAGQFVYAHANDSWTTRMDNVNRLIYTAGTFEFQEATVISSTAGAITISPTTYVDFTTHIKLAITDTDGAVEGQIWYDASEDKLKFKTAAGVETITSA